MGSSRICLAAAWIFSYFDRFHRLVSPRQERSLTGRFHGGERGRTGHVPGAPLGTPRRSTLVPSVPDARRRFPARALPVAPLLRSDLPCPPASRLNDHRTPAGKHARPPAIRSPAIGDGISGMQSASRRVLAIAVATAGCDRARQDPVASKDRIRKELRPHPISPCQIAH